VKFDEENVKNNMFFVNKLWNASRFVSCNIDPEGIKTFDTHQISKLLLDSKDDLLPHELWILSRMSSVAQMVTDGLENYNFSEVGQELFAFTKNEFCDYYIEEFKLSKEQSHLGDEVMLYVLYVLLQLWHPYIPFVTEEIYNKL